MYGCILSQCNEKDEFDRVEVRGVSLLIVTHCKSRRVAAILERVGLVMMSVVMVDEDDDGGGGGDGGG